MEMYPDLGYIKAIQTIYGGTTVFFLSGIRINPTSYPPKNTATSLPKSISSSSPITSQSHSRISLLNL